MSLADLLLRDLPLDCEVDGIHTGKQWILSILRKSNGQLIAGVASAPQEASIYPVNDSVTNIVNWLRTSNPLKTAIALATVNALLPQENLSNYDAADWLSVQSRDKNVAIFGRFPFIENEIRPFAKQVFVFEREPEKDDVCF